MDCKREKYSSLSSVDALVMWKKPWFLSQGPVLGASCHRKMLTTDASLTGWGAILEGRSSQGLWKDHHLSWHMRDISLSILVLPHVSSSSQTGHDGADMAEASSVCISPDRSAPGSPGESSPGPGSITSHCSAVAGQSMVPRHNIPSQRASSGAPRQEGPFVPSSGLEISPPTRTVETVGLASEGSQLIDPGLSTEVVETIFHSRAPSRRKLYALKWRVFILWCSDHQLDIKTLCNFLVAPSTENQAKIGLVGGKGEEKTYFVDIFPVDFLWEGANLTAQKYIP